MISKTFVLSINSFQHSYRKANIIIFEIQCNSVQVVTFGSVIGIVC